MEKINFVNNSEPYLSAENLNQMQDNIENALNDIIEVGINENGTYIKYANGLLECRVQTELTHQNTKFHYIARVWNYPHAFTEIHGAQVTPNDWSTNCIIPKVLAHTTSCDVLAFTINPVTNAFVDNNSIFVNLVAYGKWK